MKFRLSHLRSSKVGWIKRSGSISLVLKRILIRSGFAASMAGWGLLLRLLLTAYGAPDLPTYITFYPAVMVVATVSGLWPGLLATAFVVLVTDYWILPPQGFGVASFTDTVGVMLFSGMGLFMSLVAEFYRRSRKRAEESSRELREANESLRRLSARLLSAQEDERKKVAGQVHDSLGSCLTGIKYRVEAALQEKEDSPKTVGESLNAILPVILEGIEECRRIQMDLRPPMLDDLGILATLSWFCRRFHTLYTEIRIEQEFSIKEDEVPPALKIIIFRMTQEALNNIAKYSKANLGHLSLRKMNGRLEFTVRDNGRGFDLEKVRSFERAKRGLGLTNMKEIVELSGGALAIDSAEGKGTTIRASWPLE
jgi:signal transduction histidine kinase